METSYHLVVSNVPQNVEQQEIADLLEADSAYFDMKTGDYYVSYTGDDAKTRCEEASFLDGTFFKGENLSVESAPVLPQPEPVSSISSLGLSPGRSPKEESPRLHDSPERDISSCEHPSAPVDQELPSPTSQSVDQPKEPSQPEIQSALLSDSSDESEVHYTQEDVQQAEEVFAGQKQRLKVPKPEAPATEPVSLKRPGRTSSALLVTAGYLFFLVLIMFRK
ncbi:hypothetical protein P9112_002165 [Eukaryota sp. TZLM1-RC]